MRFVLPAIIVIAVVVIAAVFLTQRDGARSIADRREATTTETARADRDAPAATARENAAEADIADAAPTTISAAALDSAFFSDPQGAAERYAGPIRVTGTIATMVSPGATPSLSMEGRTRFNFMVVNFPVGYREELARLYKGQTISVACSDVRALGGTTILDGCTLV